MGKKMYNEALQNLLDKYPPAHKGRRKKKQGEFSSFRKRMRVVEPNPGKPWWKSPTKSKKDNEEVSANENNNTEV